MTAPQNDHAEFIARYHRSAQQPEEPQKQRRRLVIALVLVAAYIAVCVAVSVIMDVQK